MSVNGKQEGREQLISIIGLAILGICCLLYSIFASQFAEIHVLVPFLDFPVFVGEWLLGFCFFLLSILYLPQWVSSARRIRWFHFCLVGYIAFILIKAWWGYAYLGLGPLTFRHSALFYYPLFILAGYSFSRKEIIDQYGLLKVFFLFFFVVSILFDLNSSYFTFNFMVFIFLILSMVRYDVVRYGGIIGAVYGMAMYYLNISTRGILISAAAALLFFFFIWLSYFLNIKLRFKMAIASLLVTLGILFSLQVDPTVIKTFTKIEPYLKEYKKISEFINTRSDFQGKPFFVKVYDQNNQDKSETDTDRVISGSRRTRLYYLPLELRPHLMFGKKSPKEENKDGKISPVSQARPLHTAYANVLWRIFVWRDMFLDFLENRNIFGVNFGVPFRSRTIETLRWADGNWVGWLEPHNSYLHMLYRAGIVGVLLILAVWGGFICMVRKFLAHRNLKGILLCTLLLYWLIVANFEVILELPYFAIPFWSIYGTVLRYCWDS